MRKNKEVIRAENDITNSELFPYFTYKSEACAFVSTYNDFLNKHGAVSKTEVMCMLSHPVFNADVLKIYDKMLYKDPISESMIKQDGDDWYLPIAL